MNVPREADTINTLFCYYSSDTDRGFKEYRGTVVERKPTFVRVKLADNAGFRCFSFKKIFMCKVGE